MNKNHWQYKISFNQLQINKHSQILSHRYFRTLETSIPTVNEAQIRETNLQRFHRWKKCNKAHKLQQIYDQNCRLFISLSKQKSHYHIDKKKQSSKKFPFLKLPILQTFKQYNQTVNAPKQSQSQRYHQLSKQRMYTFEQS